MAVASPGLALFSADGGIARGPVCNTGKDPAAPQPGLFTGGSPDCKSRGTQSLLCPLPARGKRFRVLLG